MTFPGISWRDRPICSLSAWAKWSLLLAAALFAGTFAPPEARAQQIVATINGQPVTDLDLSQREKLLKLLHKPSTRDAAMQSMVDDILENQETSQFQIKPNDSQIGQEIMRTAKQAKLDPQTFFSQLQNSGISESHIKDHFSAQLAFYSLIEAFHKGVEASESQVDAELAKEGGKNAVTQYHVRQVVFVIPTDIAKNQSAIQGRVQAAEQLRARFTDCASGLALARNMDNVAVKEEVIRDSLQLGDQLKQLLDKTATGHLTPPARTTEGIEMLAVCSKTASSDDTSLRAEISQRIVSVKIEADAQKRLQELRANAVIVKK
jgi:peptidyl-prolyl cis-trans isomerase SurA